MVNHYCYYCSYCITIDVDVWLQLILLLALKLSVTAMKTLCWQSHVTMSLTSHTWHTSAFQMLCFFASLCPVDVATVPAGHTLPQDTLIWCKYLHWLPIGHRIYFIVCIRKSYIVYFGKIMLWWFLFFWSWKSHGKSFLEKSGCPDCVCVCSHGDVFIEESDQVSHESDLADRSLFVQELLLLAVTAATDDPLLPPENPTSEIPAVENPGGSPAPLLNSVGKASSSHVANCATSSLTRTVGGGRLGGKNPTAVGKSKPGNTQQQHSLTSRDVRGGAKR